MGLKIILVDDNSFYRQGFQLMLKRFDFIDEIIEFERAKDFISSLPGIQVDIVFMDIKMPDMNGIQATALALAKQQDLKIIALTMFGDEEYLNKMILAGAKGYLLKDSVLDEISEAINKVNNGECYLSNRIVLAKNKN